jgi:hypothetical protein
MPRPERCASNTIVFFVPLEPPLFSRDLANVAFSGLGVATLQSGSALRQSPAYLLDLLAHVVPGITIGRQVGNTKVDANDFGRLEVRHRTFASSAVGVSLMLATSFMAPRHSSSEEERARFPLLPQGDSLQRRFSMNRSADSRAQKLSMSIASVAAQPYQVGRRQSLVPAVDTCQGF